MKYFVLGKDKTSGKIKSVQEVKGGLACNCACPHCGEDLVAAQGQKTDWYFRHHQQSDCSWGPEAGYLTLAEEIISENGKITLPNHGSLEYKEVEFGHKPKSISHVPTLSVQTPQGNLYIVISLNEPLSEEIKASYRAAKAIAVEIDFTDYQFKDRKQYKRDLLENIRNKKMISWPEQGQHPIRKESNRSLQMILGLIGAGLVLGALSLIRSDNSDSGW